ncbi:threonine synthase [Zhouia sp. PK063]|uniref:threonine synthase n=1 Tax=Zhouia sp. PK063 TaxID=3373602 RepID=UPI00378FE302
MKYYSLNKNAADVSFQQAIVQGIAPDRGLYFPKEIKPLDAEVIANIHKISNENIAFQAIHQFISPEISDASLKSIINQTLTFDFPLVKVEKNIYTLELFHGPTMAFKDVGARFMARCLGHFNKQEHATSHNVTVLVATSGDTGGAVANGFLGVKGVNVVILYPSGKVSDIQEKQLTTLGSNITALEVSGTFDDCQDMVKKAFLDNSLKSENLTSANSINVARWLPQMFYFFFAYKQMKKLHPEKEIIFSVPSGNFGNICAGIMAQKLGLPINHFVASTNINDTVPKFMASGKFEPIPSKATISNAMDVGNPSNFIRIQELFKNDVNELKKTFSSYSFSDEQTKFAMKEIFEKSGYVADPHGAVGYLGLKKELENNPNALGVFLETAHPVKFLDVVEDTLQTKIEIPEQIKKVLHQEKESIKISSYEDLKTYLKSR